MVVIEEEVRKDRTTDILQFKYTRIAAVKFLAEAVHIEIGEDRFHIGSSCGDGSLNHNWIAVIEGIRKFHRKVPEGSLVDDGKAVCKFGNTGIAVIISLDYEHTHGESPAQINPIELR